MTAGDWFYSAVRCVVGFFLGLAAYNLAQVLDVGLWLSTIIVVAVFFAIIGGAALSNRVIKRILAPGVTQENPRAIAQKQPLLRILGAGIGFVSGAISAIFGFGDDVMAVH